MRDQEILGLQEAYQQVFEAETGRGPRLIDAYDKPPYSDPVKDSPKYKPFRKGPKVKGVIRKEEFEGDIFDYILEHLVAEGYADTNEAAIAIMANMSEEWKQSIVEEKKPIPNVAVRKQMKKKLNSDKMGDWEDVGRMSGHTGVPVPKH